MATEPERGAEQDLVAYVHELGTGKKQISGFDPDPSAEVTGFMRVNAVEIAMNNIL